ncbi:hypothetical protein [Vibrio sp. TRT 1302]|uniref:hypothetical protein n=1 Tax=Vibrio sp. TRT 1302 TaxID=3418504 RepID=UPI003CF07CC9
MNCIRILLSLLVTTGAYFQVNQQITSALSDESKIVVDGLLNIWASYAMLLMCPYLALDAAKKQLALRFPIGEINRVLLVMGAIIAPLLAIGTYVQSKTNVADYIECKSERKLSSRYSSRTYVQTEELCLALKNKDAR